MSRARKILPVDAYLKMVKRGLKVIDFTRFPNLGREEHVCVMICKGAHTYSGVFELKDLPWTIEEYDELSANLDSWPYFLLKAWSEHMMQQHGSAFQRGTSACIPTSPPVSFVWLFAFENRVNL